MDIKEIRCKGVACFQLVHMWNVVCSRYTRCEGITYRYNNLVSKVPF
jgi:hypothetical protein